MKIAIIGDGIAARSILYNLSLLNNEEIDITQFISREISICSRNSTAVVAKRATQSGISKLGDLIVEAYDAFESFMEGYSGVGVEVSNEYVVSQNLESYQSKVRPRYAAVYEEESGEELKKLGVHHQQKYFKEKAYLIEPDEFLDHLKKQYDQSLNVKQIEETIINQKEKSLIGDLSEYGPFDKIIYCIGKIPQFVVEEKSQPVAGSFWVTKIKNENSFSLSCDGHHYMQKKNTTLFGSTSNPDSLDLDRESVESIIDLSSKLIDQNFNLEEGEFKVGVRYKGKKRMPQIGRIERDTYCVANLYKNGWSMAFLAANKIIAQLKL